MKAFFKSFTHAALGIRALFISERNFKVHTTATVLVLALGLVSSLSPMEWGLITLAIGIVLVAEAMNTAIEKLADVVHPKRHPGIGAVKDMAAAGVLLAAVAAAVIGGLVFLPHWVAG